MFLSLLPISQLYCTALPRGSSLQKVLITDIHIIEIMSVLLQKSVNAALKIPDAAVPEPPELREVRVQGVRGVLKSIKK